MTADSMPVTGGGAAPAGGVQAPPPPEPAPVSGGPVLGFRELSERVIASVFDRYPWLNRVLMGVLAVCAGTCVVAVVSRLAPLPLIPVLLFVFAVYARGRARGGAGRRPRGGGGRGGGGAAGGGGW